MNKCLGGLLGLLFIVFNFACGSVFALEKLPANLKWETNNSDPEWSSPEAVKGGVLNFFIGTFPPTFRVLGPDSNTSFRSLMDGNKLYLTNIHPNTRNTIPELAISWAYGDDRKTVYYRLDPDAKWSDGVPVTVDDFVFTLEMYRSPYIMAPWFNTYYQEKIDRIIKYDDRTMAIVGKIPKSKKQLQYILGMSPFPQHFYGKLGPDFVKKFNWLIPPNTGAYQLTEYKKGKYVIFERHKNWWAKDKRYFRNRFNVDKVRYTVIRDLNVALQYFLKKQLDFFSITLPDFWYKKANDPVIDKGYVEKSWVYVDAPQSDVGIWMNLDRAIFKDIRVREAIQHSMNVEKVLQLVTRGDYLRAHTNTLGNGGFTNRDLRAREFDLQKADHLFKEAGWGQRGSDGIRVKGRQRLSLTLTYGIEYHTDRLVVLQEEARKAGIEINLKLMDSSAAFKAMMEKQHELIYTGWGAQQFPDYWGQYHSSNAHKAQTANVSNTDDPELDKLIEALRAEFDDKKQEEYARKIQARIYANAAYIPTWTAPFTREAYWRWWKFPPIPITRMSNALFEVFGNGGMFWFDQAKYDETIAAMKNDRTFSPVTRIDETFKPK